MADIKGTPHNDILRGTNDDDVIHGRGGADAIFGRGGNDNIYGDEGSDVLTGGDGTDTFHFERGSGIDFVTDLHVKSQGDNVVLHGVTEDDISTFFIEAINTTVVTFEGAAITFFGEGETDVLSAISFQPDDLMV
jgi:Ca2+-binding RTX toxin-like protein